MEDGLLKQMEDDVEAMKKSYYKGFTCEFLAGYSNAIEDVRLYFKQPLPEAP